MHEAAPGSGWVRWGSGGSGGVKTRASEAAEEVRTPGASRPPLQRPPGLLDSGVLIQRAVRQMVSPRLL